MKRNLFVITEEEKRRILGLHESATKRAYLSEQTQYVKDANGKVSVLQGPLAIPQGMTAIDVDTYNMAMKNGGIIPPTPAGPQNAPVQGGGSEPIYNQKPMPEVVVTPKSNTVQGGGGQGAKIITNNDKAYDYKEENGKYYYSKKGQNKWTEATKDPALSAIKKLKWNTATPMPSSTATTTPTTATTTPTTGTTSPTTGTTATLPTLPLSGMTAQSNLSNQQLATGPLRSAQEIRQDYRQDARQERRDTRQERRDTRQLQRDLQNLQSIYQRFEKQQGKKFTDGPDGIRYAEEIKKLQDQLGQQG